TSPTSPSPSACATRYPTPRCATPRSGARCWPMPSCPTCSASSSSQARSTSSPACSAKPRLAHRSRGRYADARAARIAAYMRLVRGNMDSRLTASSRLLPGLNGREGEGGETGGFVGGDPEQAQLGLSELVDRDLRDAVGVPLAHPQQPDQASGHRAERDLRIGHGEPA